MLHAEPANCEPRLPLPETVRHSQLSAAYVWTREGPWNDLRAMTRQVLAEGPDAKPHFLGTTITMQIGTQGFADGQENSHATVVKK